METRSGAPEQQPVLYGRTRECAQLDGLIGDIRRSASRSLVLRGEAGIGKTALLRHLIEAASDLTVLHAVGVQSEMELAFASLHQLCRPLLDRLERIPAPQRAALEIVFGVGPGAAPDRFLVGLAVLSLFSEAAEERPLLCVLDDAQWLDQASALTLAFVARRLLAEPVGIVFAARELGDELKHLPELEVRGLRNGDARKLLDSAIRARLDEHVRDRIIAETQGNPLALLELPHELTAIELGGGIGLVGASTPSGSVEETFVRRLEALSDDGRRLLLLAAAEPVGDPAVLRRAAERVGIGLEAARDVESGGLLAIGERVTFRHPLVRSAVYKSAPAEERRTVHLALAGATDPKTDPDRRAWHLAAATAAPDEQVAAELERSASRAQARGGLAAAAAFLQRAVALTQQPERRTDRALSAAQASLQAGALDAARGVIATAEDWPLDEFQQARVDLLRAQIAFASNRGRDAPPLLLGAAKRLEPLDLTLARETYLDALMAAQFAGRFASGAASEVAQSALAAPPSPSPRAADFLLDGLALVMTEGHSAAAPLLKRALDAFRSEGLVANGGFRWAWLAEAAALEVWDHDTWHELTVHEIQLIREAGAMTALPLALSASIVVQIFAGELDAAASSIDEVKNVTEAIGSHLAPYGRLILAAWRGQEPELSALIEATVKEVVQRGEGIGLSTTQWLTAVLNNGLGQYENVLAAAQELLEPATPRLDQTIGWVLPELIEAATRSGHTELARAALAQLADITRPAGSNWALGIEARSRALLSDGPPAEALYRAAIDRLERTRLRPELARAHLLYGEWLRRENRRVDARAQLRAAHDEFTSIGMEAFAERARGELLATGEHVRRRTATTRDDLTPQERQIAQLARDGLSNSEIGTRLFLSPHTVAYHLRKVFSKLEITSRNQLARVLAGSAGAGQLA